MNSASLGWPSSHTTNAGEGRSLTASLTTFVSRR